MKDLILLAFISGCLLGTLRYPFVGVLTWAWFTIVAPHQLAYGVFGIPLNMMIAGTTLLSIFIWREFRHFRLDGLTVLLLALLAWQAIAQHLSLWPQNSAEFHDRFAKTLIFAIICIQMVTDRVRFHALLWIIAGGIALFAVKGGLFTFATLGQFRIHGAENTVLEDNNHLGIATAVILPILVYLRGQLANRHARLAMAAIIFLSVFAVLGTHSRGALIALLVYGGYLWWKSRRKVSLAIVSVVMAGPLVMFMPGKWMDRMKTIGDATQDASFMGRVQAWEINFRLALDNPFTGAGLRNSYNPKIASQSAPEIADGARAAHSIYFEILGGLGFVGLTFFVLMLIWAFFLARHIEKRSAHTPHWQREYARYAKIALLVFCVGGASASLEMWDGYFLLIALVASLGRDLSPESKRVSGYAFRQRQNRSRNLGMPPAKPASGSIR